MLAGTKSSESIPVVRSMDDALVRFKSHPLKFIRECRMIDEDAELLRS